MKTAFQWLGVVVFACVVGLLFSGCADCQKCPECTQKKKVCVPVTKKVCQTDYVNEERTVCKKECVRKPRTICHDETVMKEKTICEPLPVVKETCPPGASSSADAGTK
jgi:hypothetical protein